MISDHLVTTIRRDRPADGGVLKESRVFTGLPIRADYWLVSSIQLREFIISQLDFHLCHLSVH